MKLTVVITQDEEMLVGQVQELPGILTQGASIGEVMDNIQDAVELYFLDSDIIPEKSDSKLDFKNIVSTQELEFA
ncbi:MAG: type II toxin-antitoxin system HicB family antitoxin [Dyadobacter sp.]|uniref:type II toxin-antitoxin system HicB family antitoxin n=1 Tax=Dyadobacter sp. TaxID=1914288 RepID=UPI001B290671|nr:type II toxin-antitoxin system HicB family antitoxin [Dyadobacter sp.]MBO9611920.1 type II toxin-antitoxin system HicB family antitoxin [Dyadobacter sp.]